METEVIMRSPQDITEQMMANDHFSQWLGIQVIELKEGYCKLQLVIRKEMLNGFGIAHGGIAYSLADSALAFAANSRGQKAVSIETSISHVKSVQEHEVMVAEAIEESCSNTLAVYSISIKMTADLSLIALFKGTVYRKSENW